MLCRLTVENYALIERLELALDDRLNIVTGETGAGSPYCWVRSVCYSEPRMMARQ